MSKVKEEKPPIPKYIEKTLIRRRELAMQLEAVCADLDNYCEHIGAEAQNDSAALVYHKPSMAYDMTRNAILKALGVKENVNG